MEHCKKKASGFLALGIANQPFSISLWVQPQLLAGTIMHVSTNSSGTGFCAPFIGFASNGSLIVQIMTNTRRGVQQMDLDYISII
ncbi:unnamed protein product, partial [Adineta steineri]